jgi:cupin 2 domain-containing protein
MKLASDNLLRAEGEHGEAEVFEDVLCRPGVRIERIVSRGHTTPPDKPYVQDWDEWVLVLAGSARISLEGLGERTLAAGEHLLIPARVAHLVTYTADLTIWLAVHIGVS